MVYESVLKGLSVGSLSDYALILLTSDNRRKFYPDFKRILGLLTGSEFFYVVVWRNGKFHCHMLVRKCPLYKNQVKSIWFWLHGCPKVNLESVRDIEAVAVYLACQDSIDFVDMSDNWLKGVI